MGSNLDLSVTSMSWQSMDNACLSGLPALLLSMMMAHRFMVTVGTGEGALCKSSSVLQWSSEAGLISGPILGIWRPNHKASCSAYLFIFLCFEILFDGLHVCTPRACRAGEARRGLRSLRTAVKDSFKGPRGRWEFNLGPLEEQPVLHPSFQPHGF